MICFTLLQLNTGRIIFQPWNLELTLNQTLRANAAAEPKYFCLAPDHNALRYFGWSIQVIRHLATMNKCLGRYAFVSSNVYFTPIGRCCCSVYAEYEMMTHDSCEFEISLCLCTCTVLLVYENQPLLWVTTENHQFNIRDLSEEKGVRKIYPSYPLSLK